MENGWRECGVWCREGRVEWVWEVARREVGTDRDLEMCDRAPESRWFGRVMLGFVGERE
jgi:hypothetical protein